MKKIFYIYFLLITSMIIPLNGQIFEVVEREKIIDEEGEIFMSPLWSPDGSMIAFTSASYNGIWVYNLENQSINQITDERAAGFKMQWSPDSKAILTRVAKYEGIRRYNAVKIFNIETGEAAVLTEYDTKMPGLPQWVDAGEKVFFYGEGEAEIFDSGIKPGTDLKENTTSKVVYLKNDKIAVEDVHINQVEIYEPVPNEKVINIKLSPDEKKIAFEIMGGNMYVMNIDGTGLTDLGRGYRAAWSPDSQHLVYMITEDDGHQVLSSDIFTIKIDGTQKTNLSNTDNILEMNPDWSPDGNSIVFDNPREGAIYRMEIVNE
jgi:Tol biopolymer transport system component